MSEFNRKGLSNKAGLSAIRFNTALTWGFPVLIMKSAIITPRMVVTGAGAKAVSAETEAIGPEEKAGTASETGLAGAGL